VAALAAALAPVLTPEIAKAVREQLGGEVAQQVLAQSTKDRRLKVLEPLVGVDPETLKTLADQLKANDGNIEAAVKATQREIAIDRLMRGEIPGSGAGTVAGTTGATQAEPIPEAEQAAEITTKILSEAEIDPTDPEYVAFVAESRKSGKVKTARDWENALRPWAVKQVRQRTISAASVAPASGPPPATPAEKALRNEYEKKRDALMPGDVDGLFQLKQEYRKKGLADLF
jgi:hypothetical protein